MREPESTPSAPSSPFSTGASDPWCPGCGHTPVARALQEALGRRFAPKDVVLVTDIGCIGMADGLFSCHTVHGLHGRSPALGAGIAITRGPDGRPPKVVVLMGDGGAAIGLQHVLECARLNVALTLVVCNNQNYGMTGGQHSAYTCLDVVTTTTPGGNDQAPFRLCELVAPLGVHRARALATDRGLVDVFDAALAVPGFSLVETMSYCPSYTGKQNPDQLTPRAMKAFFESQGLSCGVWPARTGVPPFRFTPTPRSRRPEPIERRFDHALEGTVRVRLAGSAGEGVQSACDVFARAAISAGLAIAVGGEYPVTVGKGFSAATLTLTGRPRSPSAAAPAAAWDHALACSADGLAYLADQLADVAHLAIDASLEPPARTDAPTEPNPDPTGAGLPLPSVSQIWFAAAPDGPAVATPTLAKPAPPSAPRWPETETVDFRGAGRRQAAFAALVWLLDRERWFPREALLAAVQALPNPRVRASLEAVLGVAP